MTLNLRPPKQRYLFPGSTRIVPRKGDLARIIEDVRLEGGSVLPRDQNVLIWSIGEIGSPWPPEVVGVQWRDSEGTHSMALDVEKLEVVA